MPHVLDRHVDIRRILEETRTIAVLGASDRRDRAGFFVGEYLRRVGYRVFPVNPLHVGQVLFGQPVVARLANLPDPVDMIDVFRRPDALPAHVDEILALAWKPRVVWFQLGVRNDAAAKRLVRAGIDVVQDRCALAEHRALKLGP